jgi:hypothetical protein
VNDSITHIREKDPTNIMALAWSGRGQDIAGLLCCLLCCMVIAPLDIRFIVDAVLIALTRDGNNKLALKLMQVRPSLQSSLLLPHSSHHCA